ncbi:hypothetical protein K4K61_006990 [Colletotrichum sp. SAR11_59]|nr:hypothetical protein K4K61_006990 [Colletotrichum sp. SAR11_59]
MAKLTNLPDDVLFIIADLLRHRGMTIDEAIAQAHKDDSVDSDRAISRCLLRGFDDVRNLSFACRRFQCVMRQAWPRSQRTNYRFDKASVAFLHQQAQQASDKGLKWSEDAWLSNDQGWHGHRIETITLLLLANLPNLPELGLALSGGEPMTSPHYDLGQNSDLNLRTLCPQLSSLALRPVKGTIPVFKGLYSIIGKIGAEPTHLYIDNLYPVRMGVESAGLCPMLFEKVTHLTIAGTISGGEYRDAFDSVMADCGPLLDFRLGERHIKTLRSLVIDLSDNWVSYGKSGIDYLDEFENLENLWIDGDSLSRGEFEITTVHEKGEQLYDYYEDALWSLPTSLKRICFTHELELFKYVLPNFAENLDYLTNLERVYLKDLDNYDGMLEDLKEEFEKFGVPVTITEAETMTGLCGLPMELLLMTYSFIPAPYTGKRILDEIARAQSNSATVAHDISKHIRRDRAGLVNLALTCKRLGTLPLESTWRETNFGFYAKDSQEAIFLMIRFLRNVRKYPAQFSSIRKLFIYVDEVHATPAEIPDNSRDFVIQALESIGFDYDRVIPGNSWHSEFKFSEAIQMDDSEALMGTLLLAIILHLPRVDDMAFNVTPYTWKYLQEFYKGCMNRRLVAQSLNSSSDDTGTRDAEGDGSDVEQNALARGPTGHRQKYAPLNTMLMGPKALRQTLSDCRQLKKFIYVAQGEVARNDRDLTAGDVIKALEVHAKTLRTICVDCRSLRKVHPIKSLETFTALENLWLHVDSFFEFKQGGACDPETLIARSYMSASTGSAPSMCRNIQEKLLGLAANNGTFAGGNDSRLSDYEIRHPALHTLPASLKKFHSSGPVRFLLSDLVSMWEKHATQHPIQRLANVLAIDEAAQDRPTKHLLQCGNIHGLNIEFEIDSLPQLW